MEFLTQDELLSVLKIAQQFSTRDWLMILMTYSHGMRREEVCQLKLDNIQNGEMTIQRLKGSRKTTQPLEAHKGEPLLDEVRGLKRWLAERPKDSGDALFPSQLGGCMTGNYFAKIYRRYATLAGFIEAKRNPHTLKHTLANHLIRGGMNIAMVQTRLGHTQISSTLKYISISDSEAAEAAHNVLMSSF